MILFYCQYFHKYSKHTLVHTPLINRVDQYFWLQSDEERGSGVHSPCMYLWGQLKIAHMIFRKIHHPQYSKTTTMCVSIIMIKFMRCKLIILCTHFIFHDEIWYDIMCFNHLGVKDSAVENTYYTHTIR